MNDSSVGEVLEGLWRFEAMHPDWTEEDGGEEGWEQHVAWWAIASGEGIVLVDPLVSDWAALDRLVGESGGCIGIVRTCYSHQRSVADAAARYDARVWAKAPTAGPAQHALDHSTAPRPARSRFARTTCSR
jgi:hypothetical protein